MLDTLSENCPKRIFASLKVLALAFLFLTTSQSLIGQCIINAEHYYLYDDPANCAEQLNVTSTSGILTLITWTAVTESTAPLDCPGVLLDCLDPTFTPPGNLTDPTDYIYTVCGVVGDVSCPNVTSTICEDITVTVKPQILIELDDVTICEDETPSTLTATITPDSDPNFEYRWYDALDAGGTLLGTTATPEFDFSITSDYSLEVVDTDPNLACPASEVHNFNVRVEIPPVAIIDTTNFNYCGKSFDFDASSSIDNMDASNLEYEWDFGDGNTSTDESGTHTYDDCGEYTVILLVTDPDIEGSCNEHYIEIDVDVQPDDMDLGSCPDRSITVECLGAAGNETYANQWDIDNIIALRSCVIHDCPVNVFSDYSYGLSFGSCDNTGAVLVTYTLVDACGETETVDYTLEFEDNSAPDVSSCTADLDITLDCDENENENNFDTWNADNIAYIEGCATDVCDDQTLTVTPDLDFSDFTYTCGFAGSITVTYTVTDACGSEEVTVEATFTIEDNTAPVLSCPTIADVECITDVPPVYGDYTDFENDGGTVTDLCGINFGSFDLVSNNTTPGNCNLTVTRTYEIEDECGNRNTCVQTIDVIDLTDPIITCPADETFACDLNAAQPIISVANFITQGGTVSDNCEIQVTSFNLASDIVTTSGCIETHTRTYEVSDFCGNVGSCEQVLIISDEEDPMMVCPANQSTSCLIDDVPPYADYNEFLAASGGATDNCGIVASTFALINTETVGTCPTIVTRTYQIEDACGNLTTCSQDIEVFDTENPLLGDADPTTTLCDSDDVPVFNNITEWEAANGTVSDNCDDAVVRASFTFISESNNGSGCGAVVTRTYSVTDACGNVGTAVHEITVDDTELPSLSCPADITTDCALTQVPSYPNLGDFEAAGGVATDNCGINIGTLSLISETTDNGDCPETYTRTYRISDLCGNTNTCEQDIVILDEIDPVITCPAPVTVQCESDQFAVFDYSTFLSEGGTMSDNCGIDQTTFALQNETDNTVNCGGTVTRTFVIYDNCNNFATCDFVITVNDNTVPVITCPNNLTTQCDIADLPVYDLAAFEADGGVVSDNCEIDPTTFTLDSEVSDNGTCPETVTRIYQIEDLCGNVSQCTQIATIYDDTPPTTPDLDDVTINCAISNYPVYTTYAEYLSAGGSATDNCGMNETIITFIEENASGTICPITYTRVYQIQDLCGNTSTFEEDIIVIDNELPQLYNIPGDITVTCDTVPAPPVIGNVVSATDIYGSDNCPEDYTIVLTETSTQTFDNSISSVIYTIDRTWTITDYCGNEYSETQNISVLCEYCDDGIDNDGNGQIDEDDDNCPCSSPAFKQDCNASLYYFIPPIWRNNNSYNGSTFNTPSSLVITTPFGAANVIIRDGNNNIIFSNPAVTQGTPWIIALNANQLQTHNPNTVERNRGFYVESDQLIQVIYRLESTYNKAMVTVKGEQALGQRFRAGSQTVLNSGSTGTDEYHFISVMAVEDNTDVTFNTEHLMFGQTNNTWTVNLDANETYLTRTRRNESVSGDLITATNPIAVTTGSSHSAKRKSHGRDAGMDQIVPTCVIGSEYVVTRGRDTNNSAPLNDYNYAAIVAITANTEVRIDGALVAVLNAGEVYTYHMPPPDYSSHLIRCSEPAYVYQFGSVESNGEEGMAIAAPVDGCRGDTYIEFSRFPGAPTNIVSVIIPNAGLPTLTLNGALWSTFGANYTIGTAPGLGGYSIVTFFTNALLPAGQTNVVQSDEYFTASHFVGNSGGGTFGYLTSFKDKIDVFHPETGQPTVEYFVDTICAGQTLEHCIVSSSCSGSQFINSILDSPNTGDIRIFNNSDCFEYTGAYGYEGEDQITVLLSDQFGFTQPVCLTFYVKGLSPTIDCPSDIDEEGCDISEFPAYVTLEDFIDEGGDVCEDCYIVENTFTLLSEVNAPGSCPTVVTRTYEIANDCDLRATCVQTITINDTTSPEMTCPPALTAVCSPNEQVPYSSFTQFTTAGGVATDNCDLITTSFTLVSDVSNGESCPQINTRTYSILDACGNIQTCEQILTITDDIPPVMTCPNNLTAVCDISEQPAYTDLTAFTAAGGSASDNCGLILSTFAVLEETNGESCPETITRTYSIEDACENEISCVQTIIVDDNTNPTMTCPTTINLVCDISEQAPYADYTEFISAGGAANDNCVIDEGTFTMISEISNGNTCPETVTRVYEVRDLCDNLIQCSQSIIINDDVAPTITCADPITIVCDISEAPAYTTIDEFEAAGGSVDDNCAVDRTRFDHVGDVDNGGTCPKVITRTYRIYDLCGNSTTCTQDITIDDDILPTMVCPDGVTVSCQLTDFPEYENYNDFIANGGSASDNCDIDQSSFELSEVDTDNGNCPEIFTRTYRIADLCGNFVECSQTVEIFDTTDPIIECPANITTDCLADDIPPYADYTAFTGAGGNAFDNCEIDPSSFINTLDDNDGLICQQTVTRIYQIADLCGNTAVCTQVLVKNDTGNPTIVCPPALTAVCSITEQPAYVDLAEFVAAGGVANDNCTFDGDSFGVLSEISDGNSCPETVVRTYQVGDECGNLAQCEQTIVINDVVAPVISTCPPNITLEACDESQVTLSGDIQLVYSETEVEISLADFQAEGGEVTDNCEVDRIFYSDVRSGTCPMTVTRTFRVLDPCLNETICVQ
ncbi:PKD domain-containing protein, partial [Portibacter lacus]